MKKNPFVSVIIANFNGERYLTRCLSSVLKTKYPAFEIVIIDDGSTDNSITLINEFKKKDSRVFLLKNEKNAGASASRNKAVATSKGEILVFLDNDTEVDALWLQELIVTLLSDSSIGGAQSRIMDFNKRKEVQVAGLGLWASTGWGLPLNIEKEEKQNGTMAVSAALAVKKDVFVMIDGFDEEEAVFTEDLDFSWRVWLAGKKILLSSSSIVYHLKKTVDMRNKEMSHTREKIYFHLTKNSLLSIIKNYELSNAIKYTCASVTISLSRSLLALFQRGDFSCVIGTLHGMGWIVIHLESVLQKRRKIQRMRAVRDTYLFQTVLIQASPFEIYKKYFSQTNLL